MKKIIITISSCLFFATGYAHEGHQHVENVLIEIGELHLILVHFPIALIIMAALAEILFYFSPRVMYAEAARFMVLWAAILSVPTVLTGLAFSSGMTYETPLADTFWWHRFFGIVTMILAIITTFWRENHLRKYYVGLAASFVAVCLTGYFGGLLAFNL